MSKKYNEIDAMLVIKGLLNLLYGDAKRFTTMRNKFKKSVSDFKVKDNIIIEVQFNNVTNDEMNVELTNAIESMRGYIARSAKKLAIFEALINLETTIDTTKPKNIKVAKDSTGKIKKVAKDSTLPKDESKEPKEVKKVKNKNEPAKSLKQVSKDKSSKASKSMEPKAKVAKTTKAGSKEKSKDAVNNIDSPFSSFIKSLDPKEVDTLSFTILEAFSGDSKLNQTMENWISKTENIVDATIGMFTSAYTRKPKNQKMKEWYNRYITFINVPENATIKKEVVEAKPEVVEAKPEVVEAKPEVVEAKPEVVEVQEFDPEPKEEIFVHEIYENIFGTISLNSSNVSKFNPKLSKLVLDSFGITNQLRLNQFSTTIHFAKLTQLYLDEYSKIEQQGLALDFEAVSLSKNILNCFTTKYLYNLDVALPKSAGFFKDISQRKSLIESIKVMVDLKPEDSFLKNIENMAQTETYVFTRRICNEVLKIALLTKDIDIIMNMRNILGEVVIRSCRNIDSLMGYVLDSTEIKDEDEIQSEKQEAIKYNITPMDISFVFQNTTFTISKLDERYKNVKDAVISNDIKTLNEILITKENLEENIKNLLSVAPDLLNDEGDEESIDIKIIDKNIMYNNRIYKGNLSADFIKYLSENNKDKIRMFKKFIQNCNENPSPASVDELYDFVFVNKLGVTPTGTILLYKWVDDNYKDCHTHTFINKPGVLVKMDRSKVNADRNVTCSRGLHLCSFGYGKFGTRLLLCEVHPRDVVSIPIDYNRSKLRCCQYITLIDITEYYGAFGSNKDFLSIAENLHYNARILEAEVMKTYPDVRRINSQIPELNGLCGGIDSKQIQTILFGDLARDAKNSKVKEDVSKNDNHIEEDEQVAEVSATFEEEVMKEVDVTFDEEVMKHEESIGEINELIEDHKNEQEEVVEQEEMPEEKINQEPEEDGEKFREQFFKEEFNLFLSNGIITDYLILAFAERTTKLETYGFDGTVKDICINNLNIDIYKTNSKEAIISFYEMYRKLLLDHSSAVHIDDESIDNAKVVEEVPEEKNKDNIKVVEHQDVKSETIVSKVTGFFKKLF